MWTLGDMRCKGKRPGVDFSQRVRMVAVAGSLRSEPRRLRAARRATFPVVRARRPGAGALAPPAAPLRDSARVQAASQSGSREIARLSARFARDRPHAIVAHATVVS